VAERLAAAPPSAPAPQDPVGEQLAALLDALHDSGLLRAATALVRTSPDLLATALSGVEADRVQGLAARGASAAAGVRAAVAAAGAAAAQPPPSLAALARRLADPDVRRGLAVALAALATLGRHAGPSDHREHP
jgi:uncharacterized protein YjgD (DUF1641 family)